MGIEEKLMKIQCRMKCPKNLYNSFGKYKYRNAEGICEAVKPYLLEQKCTLTLNDEIVCVGNRIYVKTEAVLIDTEGEGQHRATAFAREAVTKKGMDDSQITGTASSYARKYALNGLFLLDDTKDADTDEYKIQNDEMAKKKAAPPQDPKVPGEQEISEVNDSKIDGNKWGALCTMARAKKVSQRSILDYYGLEAPAQMNFLQWKETCDRLQNM